MSVTWEWTTLPRSPLRRAAGSLAAVVAAAGAIAVPTAGAVFPGANGKIAIVTEYELPCGDCDAAGQRIWVLARGRLYARADGWNPTFSPFGSRIAWDTEDGLAVNRLDDSDPVLRQGLMNPIWSPGGGELAYQGDPSARVGVSRANGKNRRQLPMIRGPFAWAPNGRELGWIDEAHSSIEAIGSDGHGRRQIAALNQTAPGTYGPLELDWLRSGWFAYVRSIAPPFPLSYPTESRLFITRAGDSERVLVPRLAWDPYAETYTWSPDGRRVAFLRDGGLWVAAIPDGREHLLVPAGKAGVLPQWSPDGRLIAYVSHHRVMTVPATGGQPRLFARFNDRRSGEEYAVDIDWQPRRRH